MGERDGGISEGRETVMKGCYQGRLGLTLIELLLVIGIIAVLAGIIWCVFAPVRERARIVYCVNNLKQLYLALEMYRADYGGVEPVGRREYWELGLPPALELLKPYLKKEVNCPLGPLFWQVWKGKVLGDSGPVFAEVIEKRDGEFPISADANHNPRGIWERPWLFVIVLRLNGQVEQKRVWHAKGSHEW